MTTSAEVAPPANDAIFQGFGGYNQPLDHPARKQEEATARARDPSKPLGLPPPQVGEGLRVGLHESVALTELGPLVIHKDGTTSRIQGWTEKGEEERRRIL